MQKTNGKAKEVNRYSSVDMLIYLSCVIYHLTVSMIFSPLYFILYLYIYFRLRIGHTTRRLYICSTITASRNVLCETFLIRISFIIIIITIITSLSHQRYLVVFHWGLDNTKFPLASSTLLCILADLNDVVIWMVSIRPPISDSSSPLSKLIHKLHFLSLSPSGSTAFLVPLQEISACLNFHFLWF